MLARTYFENKFSSEDEGDLDIDYDYQEVRSFDRSSAGSIPWAEDAIKKNQEEWERIESYFYSENNEHLPTEDKELCREILEWKRFFPNNGLNNGQKNKKNQLKTNTAKHSRDSDLDSDDETLMEGSIASTLKSWRTPHRNLKSITKTSLNNDGHTKKQSAKSVNFPLNTVANNTNIKKLSRNFAKDLRISSVPRNNKRTSIVQSNSFPTTQNVQPQTLPIKVIHHHYPHPHQLISSQSAKYLLDKYPNSIVTIEKKISPHSATYSRVEPVYNLLRTSNAKMIPMFNNPSYQFESRYGTSRIGGGRGRNQKNQIILPALNRSSGGVPTPTNVHGNNLRSISAVNHQHYENRQIRNMNLSNLNRLDYLPTLSASNKYTI